MKLVPPRIQNVMVTPFLWNSLVILVVPLYSSHSFPLCCILWRPSKARHLMLQWWSNENGYTRTHNFKAISFCWYSPKVPNYTIKLFLLFLPIFHRAFIYVIFLIDPAITRSFFTPITKWNHFLQEPKMLWQFLSTEILQKRLNMLFRVLYYSVSCSLSRPHEETKKASHLMLHLRTKEISTRAR